MNRVVAEDGDDGVAHVSGPIEYLEFARVDERSLFDRRIAVDVLAFGRVEPDRALDDGVIATPLREILDGLEVGRPDEDLDVAVALDDVGGLLVVGLRQLRVALNHEVQPDVPASSHGHHLLELVDLREVTELVEDEVDGPRE